MLCAGGFAGAHPGRDRPQGRHRDSPALGRRADAASAVRRAAPRRVAHAPRVLSSAPSSKTPPALPNFRRGRRKQHARRVRYPQHRRHHSRRRRASRRGAALRGLHAAAVRGSELRDDRLSAEGERADVFGERVHRLWEGAGFSLRQSPTRWKTCCNAAARANRWARCSRNSN